MSLLFGDYIRSRREALRKDNPAYSIRQVAKRLGIHHSYLSKVERGEPAILSERVLRGLAVELDEDPGLLMAMNGRLTESLRRAVCKNPETFSRLTDVVANPGRAECGEAGLSLLHALRTLSVLVLDRDMNLIYARHKGRGGGVTGVKCHKALFDKDAPCPGCPALLSMKTGMRRSGEVVVRPGELWLVDCLPVMDKEKGWTGFINVGTDVTGGLDAYRAMQQAERLMLHDLKSPLAGIFNLSRMMAEDDNLTDEQVDGLQAMAETAEQLLGQVRAALDVRLIESGHREAPPGLVDVADVVRCLVREFRAFNRSSGISIELIIGGASVFGEGPIWVAGDVNMVTRALHNLLANAFEAADPDDTIRIDVVEAEGHVAVSFWNPQSIPSIIRESLFTQKQATSKANGCGLGAYSARVMVESMGGSVRCGSPDGQGTTITVTLPSRSRFTASGHNREAGGGGQPSGSGETPVSALS